MSDTKLKLKKTAEFDQWYQSLTATEKTRVDARLDNMIAGHFGVSRSLSDGMFELKWKNGMRVYYSRRKIKDIDTIVLWGGFKGTQKADIAKARRLKARYEDELEKEPKKGSQNKTA
ncbi:MAG: type II toxin-antitoxin system RelE/ParE family toxin [Elusimicrobia bacterium]|nr:type II toxin-antitoxin system RelE/ParE family toxin [Elusimicrobiota bacterium]